MKTIVLLLLALATSFISPAQTSRPVKVKPKIKTIFNPNLLNQMMGELTAQHLKAVYGKALVVKKVTRNIHSPIDRDTVLMANTGADKIYIFTNKYNSYPLGANITSRRLAFGHTIRVGDSKSVFCKTYRLPTTFDVYQVSDECETLFFTFRQDVLVEASLQVMDCD